jgi:hypothetical protein
VGGGNKFFARKTPCRQGHTHASSREAKRCNELHLLLRAGDIEDLELQPQFWFQIDGKQLKHDNGRRVGYKADFRYVDRQTAARVVEDSKGPFRDNAWTLRKAIFKALYPDLLLREV